MIRFKEVNGEGFSCFFKPFALSLDNLGLVLVVGDNKDSTSATSNGGGKTALIKTVTWALYGEFIDGDKGIEVIHKEAKKARASILFVDDESNAAYEITRIQQKNNQKLSLQVFKFDSDDWAPFEGSSKKETQKKIDQIVGMDYKTWCNTVLYGKTLNARFADRNAEDKDRKNVLKQIFNLEVFDYAREIVFNKNKENSKEIDRLKEKILVVEKEIECLDVDKLLIQRDNWDTFQANKSNSHEIKIKDFYVKINKLKSTENDAALKNEKNKLNKELKKKVIVIKDLEAELLEDQVIDSINDQWTRQSKDLDVLCKKLAKYEAFEAQLNKQLELLTEDNCPVCTSSLKEGIGAEYKNNLLGMLEEAKKDQVTTKQEIKELESKIDKNNEIVSKQKVLVNKKLSLEKECLLIKESLNKLKTKKDKCETEIKYCLDRIKEHQEAINELHQETNPFNELYNSAVASSEALQQQLNELRVSYEGAEEKALYNAFWLKAFSDKGIVSFIIDGILPKLNQLTNDKLQVLSDGDITVTYDSETINKSGDVRDKISMNTVIEGLDNVTPSSAQEKKISLATAFALMDLVASRQDKKIDIQLLDEPFDSLDKVGKQRAIAMLNEQCEHKGTILATSHDADVVGAFTNRIVVERENKKSEIKTEV